MNEFKGTPGPWTGDTVVNICGAFEAGLSLGYLTTPDANRRAEGEANARLIAAAPELLGAVSAFLLYVDSEDDDTESMLQFADALDKARTAHTKAVGEKP